MLRVRTVDQLERPVLDFHRCAMLPMRSDAGRPGHVDELEPVSAELDSGQLRASIEGWDLDAYRELVPGGHAGVLSVGSRYVIESGDTVTCATELVRLTLNVAAAHNDPAASGHDRCLVYGGHTIGIALSHITRALPDLVTVVGWRSCDHLAPVFEGDVLHSVVTVESVEHDERAAGSLVGLRVLTAADRGDEGAREPVLDWRLIGVMA